MRAHRGPRDPLARRLRPAIALLGACLLCGVLGSPAAHAGVLAFATVPALPAMPNVTINGKSQAITKTMTKFAVNDETGTEAGWNVTVIGNKAVGKSPVFARYCPKATCGVDSEGYVKGGASLPASSLKLKTTGASFEGVGKAPTFPCGAGCAIDSAAAVKIASAAVGSGAGKWTATGFAAASLSLAIPTTLKALPEGEVYRVDVVWTLSSGP
jgi:hypothetical protein